MTSTKHIHHDVIIEWAKGATIQFYDSKNEKWVDTLHNKPTWSEDGEYRVKPTTKKYRVALMSMFNGYYTISVDSPCEESTISSDRLFIHWITDWVEYEV